MTPVSPRGQRVHKETPLLLDLTGDGMLDRSDIQAYRQALKKGQSDTLYDCTGDGLKDQQDILAFRQTLNSGTTTGLPDCDQNSFVDAADLACLRKNLNRLQQLEQWRAEGSLDATTSGETTFVHDEWRLLGEYDTQGNPKQETIWLGDLPIATIQKGTIYFIHPDHLGTPRALSDSYGRTVWTWDGEPFGASEPDEDADGDGVKVTYNLRFPGQYYDRETGMHQNYFRDYDPAIGGYVQSDPIGLNGGLNTYEYAFSSPLDFLDRYGLEVDLEKMTEHMRKHAQPKPTGKCGRHYREGFEAGGGKSGYPNTHPVSAKDWGQTLEKNGFEKVKDENYVPKLGDTIVFPALSKDRPDGHIEAFDGKKWISDYLQNNMIPPSYRKSDYTIYRQTQKERLDGYSETDASTSSADCGCP